MKMKNILLWLFTFWCFVGFGQDTVRLVHKEYISVFSKSKKYPVYVEWWVTKSKVNCQTPLKRKDVFKPDPILPNFTNLSQDYLNSGFDRGHMMPAADNLCNGQQSLDESFYFSNISAQFHSLNAGDWKSLETYLRNETKTQDSIKIWSGNIGEIKKIGNVSVPEFCWKVFYVKKESKFRAFLFKNEKIKQDGFENNEVSISKIESLTNLKFN